MAAVAIGAIVIEKHFTLKRSDGGVDSAFSLEPDEMKRLVDEVHIAYDALGISGFHTTDSEHKEKRLRPSVHAAIVIQKGDVFTKQNIRICRPDGGLPQKNIQN